MSLPVDVGQTLRCSTGTWTNNPTSYGYQWQRDGSDIGGATASSYTAGTADVGSTLDCVVVAHNAAGDSPPKTSNVSDPVGGGDLGYPASYFTGPLGANNILPNAPYGEGMLLSMWCSNQAAGPNDSDNRAMLEQRMSDCGDRTFDLIHIFTPNQQPLGFHDSSVNGDPYPDPIKWAHSLGSVPLVYVDIDDTPANINNGNYDSYIDAAGDYLATLDFRVMIRTQQEFDVSNMPYYPGTNYQSFIDMWRRIVDRILAKTMAGNRTNNVGFYFNPTDAGRTYFDNAWPGDDYVDWAGTECYNWDADEWSWPQDKGWAEAIQIIKYDGPPWNLGIESSYTKVTANHGKPFFAGECGCKYDSAAAPPNAAVDPNRKANWFRNMVSVAHAAMPGFIGINMFDVNLGELEFPNADIRVDSNCAYPSTSGSADPTTYQGFKDMAGTAVFNVGVVGAL